MAGGLLLALIRNGFSPLKADPFYRDLTTRLIILAAIGVSVCGKWDRTGIPWPQGRDARLWNRSLTPGLKWLAEGCDGVQPHPATV